MKNIIKLPCIFTDIDGVITHNRKLIPRVKQAVDFLRNPLKLDNQDNQNNPKIPLLFLTNRGRQTEENCAKNLNGLFGYGNKSESILKDEVILSHSALKDIIQQYENKLILVNGVENIDHVLDGQNHLNVPYITTYEYATIFRDLVPYSIRSEEEIVEVRERVCKRLGLTNYDFKEPLQINGIFLFLMQQNWEESIQIIMDVLSTPNGNIADESYPEEGYDEHIPVYTMNQDFFHSTKFRLPRLANGSFIYALKAIYQDVYKKELKTIMYGKPAVLQFEFAERQAKNLVNQTNQSNLIEFTNYYMIGDNPHSDIRGANSRGWISILVKSGVYKGEDNDPIDPATYVVQDFYEAITLICKLENIPFNNIEK